MKTYYYKKDIKNKMLMKYIINFFDNPTKNETIEATGYKTNDKFVDFYIDLPGTKINVASYRLDMILNIKLETEILKTNNRLKKLNSIERLTIRERLVRFLQKIKK